MTPSPSPTGTAEGHAEIQTAVGVALGAAAVYLAAGLWRRAAALRRHRLIQVTDPLLAQVFPAGLA